MNPKQDNVKESYNEIHNSLIVKSQRQRILKAGTEKWITAYKEAGIRLTGDCSSETMKARKQWADIFKLLKEKLSTKNSISGKPVLQEWRGH